MYSLLHSFKIVISLLRLAISPLVATTFTAYNSPVPLCKALKTWPDKILFYI